MTVYICTSPNQSTQDREQSFSLPNSEKIWLIHYQKKPQPISFLGMGDCHPIVEREQTISQTDESIPFGNGIKERNRCETAQI